MQTTPTYANFKNFGIHPDTKLNVVNIPVNAPQEVREIMNVKVPAVGLTPMTSRLDPRVQLTEQLQIIERLQEKGYNPLDYKLDPEEITLRLQRIEAQEKYTHLRSLSERFESARKGHGFSVEYEEQYNKCLNELPLYKRILKPIRRWVQNPFITQIEQAKANLDNLTSRISECIFVKEKNALFEKLLKKHLNKLI